MSLYQQNIGRPNAHLFMLRYYTIQAPPNYRSCWLTLPKIQDSHESSFLPLIYRHQAVLLVKWRGSNAPQLQRWSCVMGIEVAPTTKPRGNWESFHKTNRPTLLTEQPQGYWYCKNLSREKRENVYDNWQKDRLELGNSLGHLIDVQISISFSNQTIRSSIMGSAFLNAIPLWARTPPPPTRRKKFFSD